MNYYEDLLKNIDDKINNNNLEEAKKLIEDELSTPYIPRDVEFQLKEYLSVIKLSTNSFKSLSDDEIASYLNGSLEHQLIACNELDKKNLRDYIDLCKKYLEGNGFINAKALLIDSLIRQEINHEFTYSNDANKVVFNPSKIVIVENNENFKKISSILEQTFLKDPSKLNLSKDLLFKEALLLLPKQITDNDIDSISNKIIKYINDAFTAK